VTNPLFWLVLSFLFVTISLTIVLAVAIPTLRELARAARSAEKLFDTLRREFPPTLQAIRLTGMEISDLTDDLSEGVQSAGNVAKQVDQSISSVRKQAQKVNSGTRSLVAGVKAAWKTFARSQKSVSQRRSADRLPPPTRPELELGSSNPDLTRRLPSEPSLNPSELETTKASDNHQTPDRIGSISPSAIAPAEPHSHLTTLRKHHKTEPSSPANPRSDDSQNALQEDTIDDDWEA
jgi:hypothetical protein